MYRVIMTNTSMRDFVTSNTSVMEFDTRKEADAYVKRSKGYHPGRFTYTIKKQ